jgi:glycosyltransferase involved in cell wall biosynthesis
MILLRHGNHAALSGYDRICDYIPCRQFRRVEQPSLWQRAIARLLRQLYQASGSLWYGQSGLITELMALPRWLSGSGQIFHFVYGENSYRHMGKLKRLRRNHIVCTYHTPPKRFAEVVRDREHLRDIDAVILVSRVSFDDFAALLGRERVHFIPHGVDTEFFRPPEQAKAERPCFRCLFVGSHLRDFELLAHVARHFESTRPDIEFEVITLKKDYHYFDRIGNVTLRSWITDEELRAAYQNADVLVMPLKDATANNSLLEAMACGLPMIVSDLPGVRDYVDEQSARFVPVGECEALVSNILSLQRDAEARTRMGEQARQQALKFSFPVVARMTEDLYRKVAGARPGPLEG